MEVPSLSFFQESKPHVFHSTSCKVAWLLHFIRNGTQLKNPNHFQHKHHLPLQTPSEERGEGGRGGDPEDDQGHDLKKNLWKDPGTLASDQKRKTQSDIIIYSPSDSIRGTIGISAFSAFRHLVSLQIQTS